MNALSDGPLQSLVHYLPQPAQVQPEARGHSQETALAALTRALHGPQMSVFQK